MARSKKQKWQHKHEKAKCGICGESFRRSASYMPDYRKTTCGNVCHIIAWAKTKEQQLQKGKNVTEKVCLDAEIKYAKAREKHLATLAAFEKKWGKRKSANG